MAGAFRSRGPAALCGVLVACAAALAPLRCAAAAERLLLHVPTDLFAAAGPLGPLGVEECRIVLADGPDGSQLLVSPAMAGIGFRDIVFTVPPLAQEVGIGPLATTLRLRIPGRDPADPATTVQSRRVSVRVAGASLVLTVLFEGVGPELTGEYHALDPRTGRAGWVHALDVEADDLALTVAFPIRARGTTIELGAPAVAADFSFAVSGGGWSATALDGSFAKELVQAAIERAVAGALDLEAYRGPLAEAITGWLRDGPLRGRELRELRLETAADGGLDVLAVTADAR